MRIYYISRAIIPSRQANIIHIMKMCHAFARLGHDVTLFAVDSGEEIDGETYGYYGVAPTFGIVRYGKRKRNLAERLLSLVRLRRGIGRLPRPDLLFARHPLGLAWLAGLGLPSVLEVHRPPESALASWALGRLFARANFRGLVVISEALRKEYLGRFPRLRPEQILVVHDGADLPADRQGTGWGELPASLQEVAADRLHVGYTGHLYAGKGMELIVAVAERLPQLHFHVIGGEEADIAHWQGRANLSNLFFHGYVPHAQVHACLRQFDIVLAPYQARVLTADNSGDISQWMSPLKIFEYMAAAKPIVCSDLPVLGEVLQHGTTALLAGPQDVAGWVRAIEQLAGDEALRARLGSNAYDMLAAVYTWEKRAEKILAWLDLPAVEEATAPGAAAVSV